MVCKFCGSEAAEGSKFCLKCGKAVEAEGMPKKRAGGVKFFAILSGLLAVALAVTIWIGKPFNGANNGAQATVSFPKSDVTFSTPEKAIKYFIKAISGNDFPDALGACAIDVYAEKFDFTKFAKRLQAITFTSLAPSEYPFYEGINKINAAHMIAFQVRNFAYSMLLDGADVSQTTVVEDDQQIADFIDSVNPEPLKELKIVRIDLPSSLAKSERALENFKKQAEPFGAKDAQERVVLYELNGETYMGGFYLLNYGGDWKISGLYSNLAGTPATGVVTKMSKDDYLSMVQQ